MKIGITGTRRGITDYQRDEITKLLNELYSVNSELHHGDCVGADATVADIANELGYIIVCHPPTKDSLRAFRRADQIRIPTSYFSRNRNIVNDTDVLLVVPFQTSPQSTGGTWYTYDYALKVGKPVHIIYPK